MGAGTSGAGCAAALHRVSSRLQIAGQAAHSSGDFACGAQDCARSGAALRVRGKYFQRRGAYVVSRVQDAADSAVVARCGAESAEGWLLPEVRRGDSRALDEPAREDAAESFRAGAGIGGIEVSGFEFVMKMCRTYGARDFRALLPSPPIDGGLD